MPIVTIIADDLTGANDAGVQLARQGAECTVSPCWTEPPASPGNGASVWVFNTESRHCTPQEAARRVAVVTAFAKEHGTRVLYKKTDSVLRGPVGAELEAARRAWSSGPLVFVPAFPAAGRTVVDDTLRVNGELLEDSPFAVDPLAPVQTSSVSGILRLTTQAALTALPLQVLRGGDSTIPAGDGICAVEGETDEDLLLTAQAAQRSPAPPTCWAGPGAFVYHLTGLFDIPLSTPRPPVCPRPFLLVNGSMHPASIAQKDRALQQGYADVPITETHRETAAAIEALKERRDAALYHVRMEGDAAEGINRRLTAAARSVLEAAVPGTLLLFGGETAQSVLRRLGEVRCRIVNQIDWGVVLMEASTPQGTFSIVTKSGAFGAADFLKRISS